MPTRLRGTPTLLVIAACLAAPALAGGDDAGDRVQVPAQPVAASARLNPDRTGPQPVQRPRASRLPAFVVPAGGVFGPQSVWKTDVRSAPVAANSKVLAASIAEQVADHWGGVAAFNVWQYNASFYAVPAGQKTIDVAFDDCQNKGYIPRGLLGPGGQFTGVPIPNDAVPALGTDHELTIYQASTDTMWDFWQATKRPRGWSACWGGRIDHVSTSLGYFHDGFGSTATGLSAIGGALSIREAQAGRVDHALALQVIRPSHWADFSWPAQRSDGNEHNPKAIPEGTRFRLDPKVDVESLRLHPIAKAIARAAQVYGFIVTDRSGAVAVVTESGEIMAAGGSGNPWSAMMGSTPSYRIMQGFPWERLQALPRDYGRPAKGS